MNLEIDPKIAATVSQVASILERRTRESQELKILHLLRELSSDHFAAVLERIDVSRLVNALDDRLWGTNSRKEFLRLLENVVPHMVVTLKGKLIQALVRSGFSLAGEKTVLALFRSEQGESLSELKLLVDTATDGWDLLHLTYNYMRSAEIRLELITHFRTASQTSHPPLLRVVSDIDDTIYSSLHDHRYPKGTVYPGALALLSALSPLPPVFLTARPELIASLFERVTHRQLSRYGLERCTVLSGNLPGLFGHRRMAEQKARTLTNFQELFPEHRLIFIGDSGQGDMALAKSLLSRVNSPIERALIHRLGDSQPGSISDHPLITTFESYPQAAQILFTLGYLNAEQVESIEKSVT